MRQFYLTLIILAVFNVGCGYPPVAKNNLHLTMALRTAVSARNTEWLSLCREDIEKRQHAGEMSPAEFENFQRILKLADSQEWQAAEEQIVAWQKAQRPTAK